MKRAVSVWRIFARKDTKIELDEHRQNGDREVRRYEGNKTQEAKKQHKFLRRANPKVKLQMKTNLPARNL